MIPVALFSLPDLFSSSSFSDMASRPPGLSTIVFATRLPFTSLRDGGGRGYPAIVPDLY